MKCVTVYILKPSQDCTVVTKSTYSKQNNSGLIHCTVWRITGCSSYHDHF